MTNPFKNFLRWVRRADLIDALNHDLEFARATHKLANETRKKAEAEAAALRDQVARLTAEPARLGEIISRVTAENYRLKQKVAAYLDGVPASDREIDWTKDDQQQLADFLENKPAGKKLAQHLANRLGDYQTAAIVLAPPNTAFALCARARGFRDCRGELLRLSAAGPSPANHVAPGMAVPADLENLQP